MLSPAVLDRRSRIPRGKLILRRSRQGAELFGAVCDDADEQPYAGRNGSNLERCCKEDPVAEERKKFSAAQEAAFRLQPAPAQPNELEREMEAWWQVELLRKKCAAKASTATSSGHTSGCSTKYSGLSTSSISTYAGTQHQPAGYCLH